MCLWGKQSDTDSIQHSRCYCFPSHLPFRTDTWSLCDHYCVINQICFLRLDAFSLSHCFQSVKLCFVSVLQVGLEPTIPKAIDFKSTVYTIPPLEHILWRGEEKCSDRFLTHSPCLAPVFKNWWSTSQLTVLERNWTSFAFSDCIPSSLSCEKLCICWIVCSSVNWTGSAYGLSLQLQAFFLTRMTIAQDLNSSKSFSKNFLTR